MTVLGAVVGIIIAVVGAIGSWVIAKASAKASPYELLAKRIVDVETELITIRKQLNLVVVDRDAMALYIYERKQWERRGRTPPEPSISLHLEAAFNAAGVPWPGSAEEPQPQSI